MSGNIKVSVIIPTYNAINTIERTVNSVLNQNYNNFEIIIVDDKSKDNTFDLLKKLSLKDERIRVFQNTKNSKSAFTRNFAIEQSKGDYIMQLDDDDYCDPNRMKKQVQYLEENSNFQFVGSNVHLFDNDGVYGELKTVEKPLKSDFLKTSPFLNPTVMFRKEALLAVNGYRVSNETIRAQDYDLYLRMYVENLTGYNIQEKLVYYYKDQSSFNKSSWKYRIGEAKFRYRNFKKLGLFPIGILYSIKPILTIFIPNKLLMKNHIRKGMGR